MQHWQVCTRLVIKMNSTVFTQLARCSVLPSLTLIQLEMHVLGGASAFIKVVGSTPNPTYLG